MGRRGRALCLKIGSTLQKGLGNLKVFFFFFFKYKRNIITHFASYFTHNMFICQCACNHVIGLMMPMLLKQNPPERMSNQKCQKFIVEFFKKLTETA